MSKYRIVVMGTPDFAVPSLKALAEDERYEIVGVFTQPDRPAGRGKKLTACPVKQFAEAAGMPVYQFERLRDAEGAACLRALAPDCVITAAFGQILSRELLDIPAHGTLNVHASLLPRYRGPAPVNWCIINGERKTGVTLMHTDEGIDTGDILTTVETPIDEAETAGELTERLAQLGAQLLARSLPEYLAGRITPLRQSAEMATYYPMLKKEMGRIDWTRPAREIVNQVRGLNPWPCAYTDTPHGRLKLYEVRSRVAQNKVMPGTVIASGAREGLWVRCGTGALEVLELQAPGGKRMTAQAYLAGKPILTGTPLGQEED